MLKRFQLRMLVAALLFAVAAMGQTRAQSPAVAGARVSADQIKTPIIEADTVPLYGNTHPMARAEFDRGAVAPGYRFEKLLVLLDTAPEKQAELDNLAAAQQNPASPFYHKWISQAEFGARFGVSAHDLGRVTSWLESHGFKVDQVAAGGRLLYLSGTESSIESAFHTEIHRYVIDGVEHIANNQDPQIPRALRPVIHGVVSMHNFHRTSMLRVKHLGSRPSYDGSAGAHYLYPADYGVIYDLTTTWGTNSGAGVTIGIVGRSNIYPSDVTTFRTTTALAANAPTVDLGANGGSDPGLVTGDQDEATLDVEWSGAVAPAATVKLAPAATTQTTDGVDISAAYLVQTIATLPPIISVSYGSCEVEMGSAELAFYNSLWEQAATQGQTALVSSGDGGVAGCDAHTAAHGTEAGVNGLCSSPYSTCVGGTEFNDTASPATYWASTSNGTTGESALIYIPEVVWNESGANGGSDLWASGGGISIVYPQPSWQLAAGTSATNGMRGVPDVALTSAQHDGYLAYETQGGHSGTPSWYVDSGTSASAPSFAGILALVVKANSLAGQGNINPILYPLTNATHDPFHPTPSGNNSVPGVSGYAAAGLTYNLATGLGSVDGGKLLTAWGASSGDSGFTLTPSATSASVGAGASGTVTLSVGSYDGQTPKVVLGSTAPAGVSITFSHSSVTAGSSGTSVATIAVGANVQPGNYFIVFSGVAGSNTQTATVALTVTATPTLSVQGATAIKTVTQGATATVVYTVTGSSTFVGTVALAATGLPTGVTAAWTTSPVTLTSGVGTATLTLTASATATVAIGNVTITATGDGLTATNTLSLQVLHAQGVELAAGSSSVSMASAGTVSTTVSVYTVGGLSGSVALSVSGLPAGITGSFSPSSIASPGSGEVTLTLTGSSTATATSSAVTVTIHATATDSSHATFTGTTTFALGVTKSPATINFGGGSTAKVSVVQGATATDVVTILTGGSFTGNVSLAVTGLPTGITGSFSASTVTPSGGVGTSTLTLTATSTAAVPTAAVSATITATSVTTSTLKSTQTLLVTVVYSPQILVTASVTPIAMDSAQTSVTDVITVTPVGGYLPVGVTATVPTTFPTGITGSFSHITTGALTINSAGVGSTTLTLNGSNAAVASSTTLTMTFDAVDASSVHSTVSIAVPLRVTLSAPTLTVTAATAALSIEQGTSATDVLTVTAGGSFAPSSTAALTVTGLPAGVTAAFSTTPVTPTGGSDLATSTLTLTVGANAVVPTAATSVKVTATGVGAESAATGSVFIPVTLTYAPGELLKLGSTQIVMDSAGTATEAVTLTNVGGLVPATRTLSVSGLPAGITGAFSSIVNGASTLTLTGSHTAVAAAGVTVTITVTSTDGSGNVYVNSTTVPLGVTLSAPTLSIAPASSGGSATATVVQGATTTDAFTVTAGGSFDTEVTLSVGALPTGVTGSWSASTILPSFSGATGTASSTLTLTASSTAQTNTTPVPVTITATGDGKTATTTLNLTVSYAPGIQASISSSTLSVVSAAIAAAAGTVTVKGVGGVTTSGITLAASGLPTGMTAAFGALSNTGTSAMTLTGSNTVATGQYLVTITGSESYTPMGGSAETITGTTTLLLTVTQSAPTLALSAASSAVSVSVGTSPFDVTDLFTATGGGSFSGTVTLSVSGLPTGVTAGWSANPITPTYSSGTVTSVGTATLTLTAGGTAVVSSTPTTITVTAVGDGQVKTKTIAVTVTN